MKGLVYFEDAEEEKMPIMKIEMDWKEIKSFFIEEAKKMKL